MSPSAPCLTTIYGAMVGTTVQLGRLCIGEIIIMEGKESLMSQEFRKLDREA